MEKLVTLEHISKKYGGKPVLKDIGISIYEKEAIAIRGGNGTGKSTLLQIIAGVIQPNSGKVIYHKNNLKKGFVPERFPKEIRFTPREYLHHIGKINLNIESLDHRIDELLIRFHLDKHENKQIRELSKGNMQKVGIIQAIFHQPDLLILDEPMSGLDAEAQEELVKVITELKQQGMSIILTYHEANSLETLLDRTYIIDQGKIMKTNRLEDYPQKLIIVRNLEDFMVESWDTVMNYEKKDNQHHLTVYSHESDKLLLQILQSGGSIESVSAINDRGGEIE